MKCIILAGGSGSRLWPLSREEYPKQLIPLVSDKSLLQQTFERLCLFSSPRDIVTVTNSKQFSSIKLQLNNINKDNFVICEPISKNTAPAIIIALEHLLQNGASKEDIVLIVPSDHMITDDLKFKKTVENGSLIAQKGFIVTFGIKPTYPETGYGYVKTRENLETGYIVDSFVEKPDLDTAKKYLDSGNYYWNGGMFLGKISTFLDEFNLYQKELVDIAQQFDLSDKKQPEYNMYSQMKSDSIDYAIMEKSKRVALVELLSDWKDLGSWQAIYDLKKKDSDGNVITGKVITDSVKNSFIYSQKEIVAVSGLENIILVETEDAIMACKLDESQNVKKLYEKVKRVESDTTRLHKTVFKPWGYYTNLNKGEGYLTKIICVLPNQKLSLQSHKHRSEHWVVLEGKALVIKDDREYNVYQGESIDIPLGCIHSLQNPYEEDLKVIEVQKGDILSEDDITRYKDIYGRV